MSSIPVLKAKRPNRPTSAELDAHIKDLHDYRHSLSAKIAKLKGNPKSKKTILIECKTNAARIEHISGLMEDCVSLRAILEKLQEKQQVGSSKNSDNFPYAEGMPHGVLVNSLRTNIDKLSDALVEIFQGGKIPCADFRELLMDHSSAKISQYAESAWMKFAPVPKSTSDREYNQTQAYNFDTKGLGLAQVLALIYSGEAVTAKEISRAVTNSPWGKAVILKAPVGLSDIVYRAPIEQAVAEGIAPAKKTQGAVLTMEMDAHAELTKFVIKQMGNPLRFTQALADIAAKLYERAEKASLVEDGAEVDLEGWDALLTCIEDMEELANWLSDSVGKRFKVRAKKLNKTKKKMHGLIEKHGLKNLLTVILEQSEGGVVFEFHGTSVNNFDVTWLAQWQMHVRDASIAAAAL